jgi:membrane-bound ClpP family serine protease
MTPFEVAAIGLALLPAGGIAAILWRVFVIGRRAKSLSNETVEGEIGAAASALNPEGWVRLRNALHHASSTAPVAAGETVIVVQGGSPLQVKPLPRSPRTF